MRLKMSWRVSIWPHIRRPAPSAPAVEREFIIIGEAISVLRRIAPDDVNGISHARMIVGFRNVLAHDYAAVDDETVFGLAQSDMPELRRECAILLERTGEAAD
jgi:uncharacterized protein with HEPN domain